MTLDNRGTIAADVSGRTLTIDGRGGTFTNASGASLTGVAGAGVTVSAPWDNQSTITCACPLTLSGSTGSNAATITLQLPSTANPSLRLLCP